MAGRTARPTKFGLYLKMHGISQAEAGRKCGISRASINAYACGRTITPREVRAIISRGMNVTENELFGEWEPQVPQGIDGEEAVRALMEKILRDADAMWLLGQLWHRLTA